MPIQQGYFKTNHSTVSYPQQITRLVGLTRSEKNRLSQLQLDFNNLDASLSDLRNKLNSNSIQGYHPSDTLTKSQQSLAKLVASYLDASKVQIGVDQGAKASNANYTYYAGILSSLNNGLTTGGDFQMGNTKIAPTVGASMLNVNNLDGVFSGNFSIASMSNTDAAVTYNYLSWGKWNGTNPAQTYTEKNGNVSALAGGDWLMGRVALAIPKQGSAIYSGNIQGDYLSTSNVRSAGIMSGTINMNANFGTGALTGTLYIKKNNVAWVTSSITSGQVFFDPNNGGSARIQANLSGGTSGGISGGFFGKNGVMPTEAGGIWRLRNNNGSAATGIYRAKKQ
jgi:hypothetical protein